MSGTPCPLLQVGTVPAVACHLYPARPPPASSGLGHQSAGGLHAHPAAVVLAAPLLQPALKPAPAWSLCHSVSLEACVACHCNVHACPSRHLVKHIDMTTLNSSCMPIAFAVPMSHHFTRRRHLQNFQCVSTAPFVQFAMQTLLLCTFIWSLALCQLARKV